MEDAPLVSCIMPTYDRRAFVPAAIAYFLRQDYGNKELIVVDDGTDAVGDLIPDAESIRYIRLPERTSVGAKRNLACAHARGTLVAHWDDDDWHAPHRLSYQVHALLQSGGGLCGVSSLEFYDVRSQRAWLYTYPEDHKPWLAGGTFCYRRSVWEEHRFADVDVGEDAHFVWSLPREEVTRLSDHGFYLATIHDRNVSPKAVETAWWRPLPVESIERRLAAEWPAYLHRCADPRSRAADTTLRNVYACLVHESPECVLDLVRNLRFHDPASAIMLYNGGTNPRLLAGLPFEQYGAIAHPRSRPMRWGWLHDFALDCMRFALENLRFDTLTIVDSDQLGVRAGYSDYLGRYFAEHPQTGMLGSAAAPQPADTTVGPAIAAWREIELWRPFLRRFPDGESKFPYWTFWPTTVFTADAARALTEIVDSDVQLAAIMRSTRIWASEEIILPTLTALLGFKIAANPCSYDYVRYRVSCSDAEIEQAFARPEVYWIHPVARNYADRQRSLIREHSAEYDATPKVGSTVSSEEPCRPFVLTLPILERMRAVEGWLEDDEADLLIAVTSRALQEAKENPAIVEVGSYCGRATTVMGCVAQASRPETRIYAVDPHDGVVGALDQGLLYLPPTLQRFRQNMESAGLTPIVEEVVAKPAEITWEKPLTLLLIDGLHDYANVARDFHAFADFVEPGGYVVFHDYAPYFPGVMAFVHELLQGSAYRKVAIRRSLCVLQRGAS